MRDNQVTYNQLFLKKKKKNTYNQLIKATEISKYYFQVLWFLKKNAMFNCSTYFYFLLPYN